MTLVRSMTHSKYRQMPRHRDLLLPLRKSFYITFKKRFRSGRQ
jgi:hypothetical protein